jgi:hypothetical protein
MEMDIYINSSTQEISWMVDLRFPLRLAGIELPFPILDYGPALGMWLVTLIPGVKTHGYLIVRSFGAFAMDTTGGLSPKLLEICNLELLS